MIQKLLLAVTLLVYPASAQQPEWFKALTQIDVRVSTLEDVEGLFVDSQITQEFEEKGVRTVFTKTNQGRLTINVATTDCTLDHIVIDKGTIIEAFFQADVPIKWERFGLKKKSLHHYTEDDNPTDHYIDINRGLDISVQKGMSRNVRVFIPTIWEQIKARSRSSSTPNPYASLKCER